MNSTPEIDTEQTEPEQKLISLIEADKRASQAIAEYWKKIGFDGYW
jgi:hypothetical protein